MDYKYRAIDVRAGSGFGGPQAKTHTWSYCMIMMIIAALLPRSSAENGKRTMEQLISAPVTAGAGRRKVHHILYRLLTCMPSMVQFIYRPLRNLRAHSKLAFNRAMHRNVHFDCDKKSLRVVCNTLDLTRSFFRVSPPDFKYAQASIDNLSSPAVTITIVGHYRKVG
jgi:hypothetical protein